MANEKKVKLDVEHFDFSSTFKPNQMALEVKGLADNMDARWVRNTPQSIMKRKRMGFRIANKSEVETIGAAQPDGRLVAGGELVLMFRPRTISKKHREQLRRKARAAAVGPRESFKTKAIQANVKVEDETEEAISLPSDK